MYHLVYDERLLYLRNASELDIITASNSLRLLHQGSQEFPLHVPIPTYSLPVFPLPITVAIPILSPFLVRCNLVLEHLAM